jgi:CheY-like chemotaxis protein
VIANLLNNAAKYTEPGGQIWLCARPEGSEAVVSVRDNGRGIPQEMLARVFDMFTQVHPAGQRFSGGLGIRLTLVKRLTEMHGGRVEARSEGAGKGSEFVLRLRLAGTAQAEIGPRAAPAAAGRAVETPRGPRRVLVVDDNSDAADSLSMFLKFLGSAVRVAYDGPSALEILESFRPAIVLLDLGMPVRDDYEVARRIRRHPLGQEVVLVALTEWGQEEDRRRTAEAGFDHHLIKPVNPVDLEKLLASWEAKREQTRMEGGG